MRLNEDEITVPIYLVTGFLEAGKTSFLNFTCRQDYFRMDEPTLLINCEEGEESYDSRDLLHYATLVTDIEDKEDFTAEKLEEFQRKYRPERVIIEYNPFWGMQLLDEIEFPKGWGIVQQIVIVDGSTFSLYMSNMKSMFLDMVRNAELVLFNRVRKEDALAGYRRSIKVVNPSVDIQFTDAEGEPVDPFDSALPYDPEKELIQIEDMDYGIFFVDLQDHPERYVGKKVRFKGQVLKSQHPEAGYFIPARSAMTCCAEDMQFIGSLCFWKDAKNLKEGSWVEVTAEVQSRFIPAAGGEEPVFQGITVKTTLPPADANVYFT